VNRSEEKVAVHTRIGNNYRNWMHTAQTLFAGSTILARESERARANLRHGGKAPIELLTVWTELMLAAFGIECLVKAIWLKQGHELHVTENTFQSFRTRGIGSCPYAGLSALIWMYGRKMFWSGSQSSVAQSVAIPFLTGRTKRNHVSSTTARARPSRGLVTMIVSSNPSLPDSN
jgi:hypothetical protein